MRGRRRRAGRRARSSWRSTYSDELAGLDDLRRDGASIETLVETVSDDFLLATGYFGAPEGAAEEFARLAEGLDTAIVRIVGARSGIESARAVMRACAPR